MKQRIYLIKHFLLFAFFLIKSLHSFGQTSFVKGYFIGNDNSRVECYIKNQDWKYNPTEFEFKPHADSPTQKGTLAETIEFCIPGKLKYTRADVKIDRSPMEVSILSAKSSPEWSQEQLFLKVLLEGDASLYYYEDRLINRFFYSVQGSALEQLVYKEYLVEGGYVARNNSFRQQLLNNVHCIGSYAVETDRVYYQKQSMILYFTTYNQCKGGTFTDYAPENKDSFHLRITPGINLASLTVFNSVGNEGTARFSTQATARLGLETEYILPFNNHKWAVLFEPAFQYFHANSRNQQEAVSVHFNSIEFPLGLRYCFFLDKDLKVFLNTCYIPSYGLQFNSTITIEKPFATPRKIKTRSSFAFGAGIAYKKLSAETRYYTASEIMSDYISWSSEYKRVSLILGFKIL